ncbi:ATP-binding cassette domain-containing protein [Coprobacter tertius]|uniref:ATP-binding cassette domain-containing protein n=1 Tax=Coprobacter tertius TaxID=2944915 RepID=A0ABT1MIN2_9BACT|nr:ATP-binding cassette domain-containing protein [Coprobacter tertius]MCP9612470.1 ATP-binding cassette domain-containing protein [Coprobacter tertius]
MSAKVKIYVAVICSCLTLLAGWQWLSITMGNPHLFPGVFSLFSSFYDIVISPFFFDAIFFTFIRGLAGMGVSLVVSVFLARVMSYGIFLKAYIQPFLSLLRSIPVISFILLFLIWLRPGYIPFVMALVTMVPILTENIETGYRNLSPGIVEFSTIFGMNRGRRFKYVVYPALRPYLFSGLVSASGIGWKAIIIGEVLAQPQWGIGVAIKEAHGFIEIPELVSWTIIAVLLSYLIEICLRRISCYTFPLRFKINRKNVLIPVYSAITFENVSKTYERVKHEPHLLFENISFTIPPDGVCCITGASGVGKTTVLKMLSGLEKIDSGKINTGNHRISYLPQHPCLFPWFTVGENLMLPLLGSYTESEAVRMSTEILKRMDLEGYGNRMPDTLSGGEKQRVALARALLYPSTLWLFDEPFTGIDEECKKKIIKYITDLRKERSILFIYVSHDTDEKDIAGFQIEIPFHKKENNNII